MSVSAIVRRGLILAALLLGPSLGRAAAAYPFPQNQAQPNAAYYPVYNNADIVAVYNAWKADQVTTAGAGGFRRVQRNGDVTLQPNSTVSEGIAYGMIIAVYMNDQALFDDLWRYHNLHLDGNGLMNWYISADGNTTLGGGAASDADQDIAWALVMAHHQWGASGVLPQPYLTLAQDMIAKIWTHEVEKPSMVFRNGDGWGGADTLNVSYFDPSMYRVFAQVSGNAGWYDVVDTCYTALFNSLNATNGNQNNGLVPAWSNLAGQPVVAFAGAPTHFQYDSCRTPFRIGKDWYFFGEPRAKQYLDKINSFYVPIGAGNITDGYDLNGAERPQYDTLGGGDTGQSAAFVGPAMVGAMDVPGQAAFVQQAYDNLKTNTLLIGGPYYDQSWTVMSMLFASGNYLNYQPTPTPTPTVDACQNRVRVNVGGTAQSGFSADRAYAPGGWGYVTGYAGAVGTSGGPVSGTPDPGLYLSERYDPSTTGEIRYSFALPNGPATVTLHWAETYFNSAGQRRMDVFVGATQVENDLDVFTAAGGQNRALVRSYNTTVSGGVLTLRFDSVTANATIHAIEVLSGSLCTPTSSPTRTPFYTRTASPTRTPSHSASPTFSVSPTGTPTPTLYPTPDACSYVQRVNAGGGNFTGAGGLLWSADKAYTAGTYGYVSFATGTVGTSAGPIAGTTDDALFMAERWGDPVRYRFDLANGPYQVRVRLAESYFDTAGNRNLSLSANGATILNGVDLFTWAGGKNVARDHTFIVNVSTGRLELESWSSNNNATFMGIEVIGLSGCSPTPTPVFSATVTPTRTPSASPSRTRTATATMTPSGTGSMTPSATRTPSPSSTPTSSGTASPSQTPSSTSSVQPSPSASASPTRTPTLGANSPTHTPTRTSSPSLTSTWTSSPSLTATPTSSPTLSPSSTPSPMSTLTSSPTLTPSSTITPTSTDVPIGSSPTVTPSHTPSATVTGTFSLTPMNSATPTPMDSATVTPVDSPTVTPMDSATSTPMISATLTPMDSPTATPMGSAVTPMDSPTATPTSSASVTPMGSATATPTGSATATSTPTASASPTRTAGPVATATFTPSGAGPMAEAGGELIITDAVAWPQPMRTEGGWVSVHLKGSADRLRLRLYSPAMTLVDTVDVSGVPAGWQRLALGPLQLQSLAPGLYFFTVQAWRGTAESPSVAPGRLVLIH